MKYRGLNLMVIGMCPPREEITQRFEGEDAKRLLDILINGFDEDENKTLYVDNVEYTV